MAHEIMNSLTPLSSLTETGIMMLEEDGKARNLSSLSQQTIDNLHQALQTIADRNAALCKFIGNYRQLSRLPMPERKKVEVAGLLEEVLGLHREQCALRGITFALQPGPAGLTAFLDAGQVKQVLINLVKNAMEALEDKQGAELRLTAKRVLDEVLIEVHDNGAGIPPAILEKIFVPFFTTKAEGSGIGLSLSRQILRNHGGQLSVASTPGTGTAFHITLPLN
jgi:signal transduction histidine kinase